MRIAFVLEHYHPYIGGAEKLFKSLAEGLIAHGHEVRVVTTRFSRGLPRMETINGVQVRRVAAFGRYLFTLLCLPAAIRAARWCDMMHTTSYNAALPAFIASRLTHKPCIITFHEVWGDLWKSVPFMSRLSKWAHKSYERFIVRLRFDQVVAVSEFTRQALVSSGAADQRVVTIYNGLNYDSTQDFRHHPPDRFTCAYFGRLGVSKGLDMLLKAWQHFTITSQDARLVLIIPTRPPWLLRKVLRLVSQLGIGHSVDLHHNLSERELLDVLSRCTCVVIPSLSEGFCFAAAEACALGIPVISSHRGALPEVVSGRFVTMRHAGIDELVEALRAAARHEWTTSSLKRFPLDEMITRYQEVYLSQASGERKSPA